jgi:hypothetical protein
VEGKKLYFIHEAGGEFIHFSLHARLKNNREIK